MSPPIDEHVRREYLRLRSKHYAAREALRDARTNVLFRCFEASGDMRLRAEPDPEPYLAGDAEDEREVARRFGQHGVWGLVVEVRCACCGNWKHIDSVWGFLGDDLEDNGTDSDLRRSALDAFEKMERYVCAS